MPGDKGINPVHHTSKYDFDEKLPWRPGFVIVNMFDYFIDGSWVAGQKNWKRLEIHNSVKLIKKLVSIYYFVITSIVL